ncbi:hypothetical protein HN451_08265 [archaeon]|jgi:hypothetical protein|nr:hypothetical protein [archaeon]
MIKKINILIISHEPLTPSLKDMYCLEELNKTFNVEFLSLRSFFYKKNEFSFKNELTNEFKDFSNIFKFWRYISTFSINNTYVFLENSSTHLSSLIIDYLIKDFKLCRYLLYRSHLSNNSTISKQTRIQKLLNLFNYRNLCFLIVNKCATRNFLIVFASGSGKPLINCNKFIALNSTIISNEKKIEDEIINSNYVVFIDQGYPTHPDLLKKGFQPNNEYDFIKSYNRFFDFIEKKYNTKVIIAKHPKSSVNNNYFAGREVIVNKTKALILNSKFVIAHSSLINLYAVLNYKRILLVYNSELKLFPLNSFSHMKEFSNMLDLDLINIENEADYSKIDLSIHKLKYDLFIKKYICLNDDPNHKLIKDAILSDHKIKMK